MGPNRELETQLVVIFPGFSRCAWDAFRICLECFGQFGGRFWVVFGMIRDALGRFWAAFGGIGGGFGGGVWGDFGGN